MKNRIKIILTVLSILLLLTSCKREIREEPTITDDPQDIVVEDGPEEEPEEEDPVVEKIGSPSPLSGIYVAEERINRRPVAVMFDNHPRARWQSGLKDAEIIYEYPVEAPYTRYCGLFLINQPESLGPIRSARPYFVTTALEYDAVYVHVGGSPQAKTDIKNLKMADIDALSSSNKVFWRKGPKKAPHNTYSSMEAIRNTQEERKYNLEGNFTPFKFKEDESNINGQLAREISIQYRKDNLTEYKYDEEEAVYIRYKDGKLHIDELDDSPITAKNIIIQEAKIRVLDNEGRLEVELIGEGRGKYISRGEVIDINWVKMNREDKTRYYDKSGEELILNPGISWIQVVDSKTEIVIE